jgi:hypothetical protein
MRSGEATVEELILAASCHPDQQVVRAVRISEADGGDRVQR